MSGSKFTAIYPLSQVNRPGKNIPGVGILTTGYPRHSLPPEDRQNNAFCGIIRLPSYSLRPALVFEASSKAR
jgi:hypothetical protein